MIDKFSVKVLKHIKKNPNVPLEALKNKFGESVVDNISHLCNMGYIINQKGEAIPTSGGTARLPLNIYRISPNGLAFFQNRKIEKFRYWFPIISADALSAAALVTSIIALLK